ncbi:MAG: RsmD family RNA methyltransferase [Candidatus Gastranaerophilales bacterium]|nr:RsmD family RNA methyltransferase [Candidatus Gastranaerophilales bacterium]
MYLTAGQFKGQKIEVPQNVQPTLSKVRESVFNILLQYDLGEMKFLNMFSGSGLMGLEAISRGYKVKELEINPKIAQIIKSNYKRLKLTPDLTICDSLKFVSNEKYNVIYLDPPWDMDYKPIIKKANEFLDDNGVIVVEYDKQKNIDIQNILDELNIDISLVKSKKYGRCLIAVLKRA